MLCLMFRLVQLSLNRTHHTYTHDSFSTRPPPANSATIHTTTDRYKHATVHLHLPFAQSAYTHTHAVHSSAQSNNSSSRVIFFFVSFSHSVLKIFTIGHFKCYEWGSQDALHSKFVIFIEKFVCRISN